MPHSALLMCISHDDATSPVTSSCTMVASTQSILPNTTRNGTPDSTIVLCRLLLLEGLLILCRLSLLLEGPLTLTRLSLLLKGRLLLLLEGPLTLSRLSLLLKEATPSTGRAHSHCPAYPSY